MKFNILAAALVVAAVTGCQTAPSGALAPQDFSINASKTKTKDAIVATFLPANYRIVKDSDYQLVFDRPASDNFAAQMIYGSRFNTVPNARVTLTITGDNPTQVNSRLEIVTNPGSGFEQSNSLDGNADGRASIARAMNLVKAKAEAKSGA